MRKIYIIIALVLFVTTANSQSKRAIKGEVSGINFELTGGYSVGLLNASDSTAISWKHFTSKPFSLEYDSNKHEKIMLLFVAYEYSDKYVMIDRSNDGLVKVELDPLGMKMDEIVVTGKNAMKIQQSNEDGKLAFMIPASVSSRENSIYDLLSKIPGISVDDKRVKVLGSSGVKFIINGLEARPGEVTALYPDMIEKIIVDKSPSVKYGQNISSIINIITKKTFGDYLKARVGNDVKYNSTWGNTATVSVNNQIGKWNNYINYSNSLSNVEMQVDDKTTIYNAGQEFQKNRFDSVFYHGISNSLTLSPRFSINKNSFIDLQYTMSYTGNSTTNVYSRMDIPNYLIDDSRSAGISDYNTQNIALRYNKNFDNGSTLTVNTAYSFYKNNGASIIREEFTEVDKTNSKETIIENIFNSESLTTSLDYKFKLFKKLNVESGMKYAYIKNNSSNYYPLTENIYTNDIREHQAGVYLNLSQSLKKFYYSVGVRGEYNNILSSGVEDSKFRFMPSASVNYRPTKKISMSLNFSRYSSYPTLRQLDPSITYTNNFHYHSGNKDLKPTITNSAYYSLNLPLDFNIHVQYVSEKDRIELYDKIDKDGATPLNTITTYRNIKKVELFGVYVSWMKMFKKVYSLTVDLGFNQLLNKSESFDGISAKPNFRIDIRNTVYLSKTIYLSLSGYYNTEYDFVQSRNGEKYGLSAALNVNLLKNKLNISIKGNNLIYKNSKYSNNYREIVSYNTNITSDRAIILSVTYKINDFKNTFSANRFNSDTTSRLR